MDRRREHRQIRRRHDPRLHHAVAPRTGQGLYVEHLAGLEVLQQAEESIPMPGYGCITCGVQRRGALDVADAAVELR